MDETRKKYHSNEKGARKENVDAEGLQAESSSVKIRAAHGDRSPKPKDGEKLRERLAKSKHVWRKESMEKRPRSGPLVARHSITQTSNLRLDTAIAHSVVSKSSLRPTSPTYESAFKRQVVNRPHSPVVGISNRRLTSTNSFSKGHKRPLSPHSSINPEEFLKRRIEKAKRAKLYLLQQAGPNTFIIGGGESQDHRHKVTIGPQTCTCGRGCHCVHILFVMVRVFELPHTNHLLQAKLLKNFEVESLFRKYESRRKQRLSRTSSTSQSSADTGQSADTLPHDSSYFTHTDEGDVTAVHNLGTTSNMDMKIEPTCPICLLDLVHSQHLVHCENCNNKLHNDCMAIWYQLVKKQGDILTCPLCRSVWPITNTISFSQVPGGDGAETHLTTGGYNASPNSLGTSPVSGFVDIEPSTLLPRSQPIPAEQEAAAAPWVEMFGEDLIGCLFMKNEWVMRETALRHLSRETIMLLSNPSEQDMTSSPTGQSSRSSSSSSQSSVDKQSCSQSRIEFVLEISCQILTMMMADPVYKVYVASLRSLRTMLCYCTLPDVTKLRSYMKPVIQSIVLKCADGNRKTNQLSMSTLCEFSKDQEGELAIGRELNLQGQTGLGGCMYVLECCICCQDVENPPIQWLNGRLLIMNQLLEDHHAKFSSSNVGEHEFADLSQRIIFPMIEFAVMAVKRAGNKTRTIRFAKRLIIHCVKHLSAVPGMSSKIKSLLGNIDPDLRGRVEKWIIEISFSAQQAAIDAANNQPSAEDDLPDISEPRPGSPPLPEHIVKKARAKRPLVFGSLYQMQAFTKEKLTKSFTADAPSTSKLPRHTSLYHRRSDSYTEAVYDTHSSEGMKTRSLDDTTNNPDSLIPDIFLRSQLSDSFDSIESVEADNSSNEREFPTNSGVEKKESDDEGAASVKDDGDITLTESAILSSDSELDVADGCGPQHKSPRKLSRGRVVMGSKPFINVRNETEHDKGSSHNQSNDQNVEESFDVVDGVFPHTAQGADSHVTPHLHSHDSMGFEPHNQHGSLSIDDSPETQQMIQPDEQGTDSESCTDNISQSVSISISSTTSDDNDDELSDNETTERPRKSSVPFRGYRRGRHTRCKTDPCKLTKSTTKSPRYHSDPAGGDSTSSSASTPRSPSSSSAVTADIENLSTDVIDTAIVRPVSRALTFSQPATKPNLPTRTRPQSMRTSKGSDNQLQASRLPSRGKASAMVPPITSQVTSRAGGQLASAGLPPSPRQSQEERQQSSSALPAAIRALTPPNSPLKASRSSTPIHSAPTSPILVKRPSSRSPSPPVPPITAIVRPQANYAAVAPQIDEIIESMPAVVQVVTYDVEPSRPIQRQSSATNIDSRITVSTSSGSDDHKVGADSSYVEDLSDSAVASPYEKAVSFKTEVALFSPRNSVEDANCHCKDEVELEEAIALAKAMEISTDQSALPQVPGLSTRRQEETITIHVQPDQTDAKGKQVEYLENTHWKRGMMIGTGAFSTCYQCRDVRTGTIMAVKQISFCRNSESEQDTICTAVIEEIRMMATLNHPNIVRILGATQTGAHFNMFVEWMPGGSVSHLLERYGSFSEPVITSYTQQVLMGLAYLHDHQILHRDMKGANLLVDSTGKHLRIGDFGACAQLASSMTGAGELKGQLLGTIAFMAPEVLRGEHYGRGCDVWSVGCVIIEMVTTKPPWNASNVSNHLKLIFKIASANTSPPIPDNLPPAIKDLMLRCLETESKNRPPAKELLQHPLFTRSHYPRR